MILAIKALVPPRWVPTHFTRPPKVHLILYPLENLWICSLKATFTPPIQTSGSTALDSLLGLYWKPPKRESLLNCEVNGAFPLLCCLSSFSLLCSSILLTSWCMFLGSHIVRDSLNSDSSILGSSTLTLDLQLSRRFPQTAPIVRAFLPKVTG